MATPCEWDHYLDIKNFCKKCSIICASGRGQEEECRRHCRGYLEKMSWMMNEVSTVGQEGTMGQTSISSVILFLLVAMVVLGAVAVCLALIKVVVKQLQRREQRRQRPRAEAEPGKPIQVVEDPEQQTGEEEEIAVLGLLRNSTHDPSMP